LRRTLGWKNYKFKINQYILQLQYQEIYILGEWQCARQERQIIAMEAIEGVAQYVNGKERRTGRAPGYCISVMLYHDFMKFKSRRALSVFNS
jgi:hypothetical protein